ncbi:413_t:CDS:2, partial [Dentiscutata erythropus]
DTFLIEASKIDLDSVNQLAEGKILLENNEIEEIVANLPDVSLYAPETAQAITTYLQIIDESVATEEILNDDEIISMLQADENEESTRQEIDKNEVPNSSVTAAESNIFLKELGFLRNLLKEYKQYIPQDLYFQDSSYSQDSYSQDPYSQGPHFQDLDLQKSDSQELDSQES